MSTREIAVFFWLFALLIFVLANKVLRDGLFAVVRVIFMRRMVQWALLMIGYLTLVCYGLAEAELWSTSDLKATTLWLITAGFYMVYRTVNDRPSPKRLVADIFRNGFNITVMLEFLIGMATFPLPVELILVPVAGFLAFISTPSKTENAYEQIGRRFANATLTVIGLLLVVHACIRTFIHWKGFWQPETGHQFLLPVALSVSFIPYLWSILTHLAYKHVFIRLNLIAQNRIQRLKIKARMLWTFGIRYDEVINWWRYYNLEKPEGYPALVESLQRSRDFRAEPYAKVT